MYNNVGFSMAFLSKSGYSRALVCENKHEEQPGVTVHEIRKCQDLPFIKRTPRTVLTPRFLNSASKETLKLTTYVLQRNKHMFVYVFKL